METTTILQKYGLTDKETKVYLASLELGTASITQLSKKANLKRPTTYLIIDDLLKKQLLIAVPQGKKTCYKPENPESLPDDLEQKKKDIETILPQLKSLYTKSSKKPRVRYYEGKEGLIKIYEEAVKSKEIWSMFGADKYYETFDDEFNQHLFRILSRQGGIIYDLVEDTKRGREDTKQKYKTGLREHKFLPKGMHVPTDILVFGDRVAIISLENVMGVIIEDEAIALTQKTLLEFTWNQLPEND